MQNAAFAARGLDWTYVPLQVENDRLEAAVAGLVALGFAGANVTIPHKTGVLGLCDEVDEVAKRAGSVNTLVVRGGRVHGSSTDGVAVTSAVDVAGRTVLVLGAGGAAQAVAIALADAGPASLTVAARRGEAAWTLARRIRELRPELDVSVAEEWPPRDPADLIVNGTPVKHELVVVPHAGQAVVDLAYLSTGEPTALVAAARETGCQPVIDGLEVLVRQGAASFECWTGVEAPIAVMRAAIRL
jgi:shikimate dehydrogenase